VTKDSSKEDSSEPNEGSSNPRSSSLVPNGSSKESFLELEEDSLKSEEPRKTDEWMMNKSKEPFLRWMMNA